MNEGGHCNDSSNGEGGCSQESLEKDNTIDSVTRVEFMIIFKWHSVTKPGDGKVLDRREKWRKIIKEENVAQEWNVQEVASFAILDDEPILI